MDSCKHDNKMSCSLEQDKFVGRRSLSASQAGMLYLNFISTTEYLFSIE